MTRPHQLKGKTMDETEKRLMQEGNALKRRELELQEKHAEAVLATMRAILVTVACGFALWWGTGVLRTMEADVARAVFWVACASTAIFYGVGWMGEGIRRWVGFAAMLASIFVAVLAWSRF